MLKKIRHFLIEVASRIFMNLVKLVLGASIGMAYVSVEYGKDLTMRSSAAQDVAIFVLTGAVLIISVIETFADWEYSPEAKAGEKAAEEKADADQKAAQSKSAA